MASFKTNRNQKLDIQFSKTSMKSLLLAVQLTLLIVGSMSQFSFNLTMNDKNGVPLGQAMCNKDSQIDFSFSSSSILNSCNSNPCSITSPDLSSLRFFDAYGNNLTYNLKTVEYTTDSTSSGAVQAISFQFTNVNRSVIVIVPLTTNSLNSSANIIDLSGNPGTSLDSIKSFLTASSNQLSSFNFLNLRDYGHFYTVVTSPDSSTATTILTSSFLFFGSTIPSASFTARSITIPTMDQLTTGDKLCYASLTHFGLFQTHIRENYPLWTAWISILIYWLYILLLEPNTLNCYDKEFQENSMTCWGFYSLFFLGNEEYFTKLSRCTLLLASFVFQAVILAIIFSTQYQQDYTLIIWASILAFAASVPLPFLLGGVFLSRIYSTTVNKFEIIRKSKEMVNKESSKALEDEIDIAEEKLYGLYYWFYIVCFAIFVTSWVLSVHLMIGIPRDFYGVNPLWLASLGITFVLDNLVYDPIMARVFGSFDFYRMRGHFYDFRLGELNRIISDE